MQLRMVADSYAQIEMKMCTFFIQFVHILRRKCAQNFSARHKSSPDEYKKTEKW